ncbi:ClpXP protease specificity-enhancing factor [Parashewanella tropica]|uniref:ClpXP protease specificity-enhancing factor n=1 Tax=Parashewanella tropica TaxID=2547970 RepID=UPI0010593BCA|nr:ClpXP protease specificity-enhancing factor [Parashewanella tropica]
MLTPNRPYLLRAYYEWLLDNDLTPHLVVDAFVPGTQVPQQYVKDGQIVLNVAPSAVMNLEMGNSYVEFNARFGGVPHHILLPMAAIVAIYARENGAGSVFDMEEAFMASQEEDEELTLSSVDSDTNEEEAKEPIVEEAKAEDPKTKKPPKKRGHLTVVK